MLKVTSVTHALLVTPISQLAQVTNLHKFNCKAQNWQLFFTLQLVPVILKELLAILTLAMTVVYAHAKWTLMVTNVTHALLVTPISQLAQVPEFHKFNCIAQNWQLFFFAACACNTQGTVGNNNTCDDSSVCSCQVKVEGDKCDTCSAGYSNFPACTGTRVLQIQLHSSKLTIFFSLQLVPVIPKELSAIRTLVMTVVYVHVN